MSSIEEPTGPEAPAAHPRDQAEENYKAALKALDEQRPEEAEVLLRQAAELAPQFKTFERLGELAVRRGDLAEGTVMLAAAVGLGVNQARARILLAEVLAQRGEIYVAAMKLTEALRIDPNHKRGKERLKALVAEHPWLEEQLR